MSKFNLKILLVLSLGHLVTDIYQSALPTILPFLKENLSLSYTMAGVILMAANFTSSLIQPLFGFLSDKQEKAFLLPLGCLCAGAGFSLLSFPSSYALILMLVIVSGFGIASYHPEGYKTAHFFTGEKRVTGMAIFAVGGNLGFALGPIIAIYIIKYMGFSSLPVIIVPSVVFVAIIIFYWRDISITEIKGDKAADGEVAHGRRKGAYISLSMVIAIVIMRSWTQMGLMSYIPFYYINHLKGDPLYAGKLVFVLLLGGVIGTLGGAPLADRWGHKRYLILSMFLSALILPLIFIVDGYMLFVVLGSSRHDLDFNLFCYRCHGTAVTAEKSRRCLRPHGRFCYRSRRHLRDAARSHCRSFRCACRPEIHHDPSLRRIPAQRLLTIPGRQQDKNNSRVLIRWALAFLKVMRQKQTQSACH